MVDPLSLRRWSFRALFVAAACGIIFIRLLPFHVGRDGLPAPDLLLLTGFAWALRRPDFVPVWLIALTGLAADILFMRPLGLWAALAVLGTEFLRRRSHLTAEQPFPVEWLLVSGVLLAMQLCQSLVLALLIVPQPPVGASGLGLVMSILAYPFVVLATAFVFGVRPAGPAERDAEARA